MVKEFAFPLSLQTFPGKPDFFNRKNPELKNLKIYGNIYPRFSPKIFFWKKISFAVRP
jgi:hypothetical protein